MRRVLETSRAELRAKERECEALRRMFGLPNFDHAPPDARGGGGGGGGVEVDESVGPGGGIESPAMLSREISIKDVPPSWMTPSPDAEAEAVRTRGGT